MQDDAKPLRAYNVTASSRLLVTRGTAAHSAELAGAEAAAGAEEARAAKLERLKAAADRMAARGDGRGLTDRYEFSLENQVGVVGVLKVGVCVSGSKVQACKRPHWRTRWGCLQCGLQTAEQLHCPDCAACMETLVCTSAATLLLKAVQGGPPLGSLEAGTL